MRRRALRVLILAIVATGAIAGAVVAEDRPSIYAVELYTNGGHIVSRLSCRGLFSEQVTGTVESGLPAVVEFLYELQDGRGKRIRRGLHSWEIVYDVWGDVYTVNRGDTSLAFSTFQSMATAVENPEGVGISDAAGLDPRTEYVVAVAVAIYPLRGTEEEQIVGWVDEQVGGGSSRSWRERVLDVGDLVQRLFSHDRDTSSQSEWFRTPPFRPASLRHERGEASPATPQFQFAALAPSRGARGGDR